MFRAWSRVVATVVRGQKFRQSTLKQIANLSYTGCRLFALTSMSKVEDKMGNEKSKNSASSENNSRQGRVSRENVEEQIQINRDEFLNMSLEEKRTKYKCGSKFVTPDAIQSWPEYAIAENVMGKYARTVKPPYTMDEELNGKISLWRGDITALEIDAIVNAANNSLMGGGGVDGAIHIAAGNKLREECAHLDGCKTGDAKISGGYKMPAKYIIHTVGPIGVNAERLASCYKKCLDLSKKENIKTVAFPCISTGIYGYDVVKATPVVMKTVRDWLLDENNQNTVERVIFCVFLIGDVAVYEENLLKFFPLEKDRNSKTASPKERKKPRKKDANKSDADTIETDPKATPDGKTAGKRNKPKTESGNKNDTISDDVNGDTAVSAKTSGDVKETVNGNGEVDDSSPAAKKKPPNPEDKDNSAEGKGTADTPKKASGDGSADTTTEKVSHL